MADTHETIADIIAEKRRRAAEMEKTLGDQHSFVESLRNDADRLDAAYKREKAAIEADALSAGGLVEAMRQKKATAEKSSAVGDAAKLREAVIETQSTIAKCMDILNKIPDGCGYNVLIDDVAEELCDLLEKHIKAALAAPPRNCDIYLTEEAVDAATVTVRDCEACSRIDMEAPCVFCMVRWLLAPAQEKEGGAK